MHTHSDTRLEQLRQIAMPVQDIERAVAFYRDRLHMRFLFRAPPGLGFFDCGGVRLMLSVPEDGAFEPTRTVLYFGVPDVHAAHAALEARGVTFEVPPRIVHRAADHDLWIGAFRDSEGNLLAIMSEVPHA